MGGTNPVQRGIPFAGPLTARVSEFADDITVFVSRRLDLKAVTKAGGEYELIPGAKINFDKSEGLRLFQGPSAGVTDPSASSWCGSGPTFNWS